MSINLPLLNFIRSKPWAITIPGMQQLAAHAQSSLNIELEDCFELRPETITTPNGTAIVHVHNALVDSCCPIYEKLGMVTCYETIMDDIEDALEDGAKRVMLVINSPGGTVTGLRELSEFIEKLEVPSVSYCRFACSAAYHIAASASNGIIASPSAMIGNIGTILSWADADKYWEMMGVEWKALVNKGADLKSTFHLEPDEVQLKFLQDSINESGAQFQAHVLKHRPTINPEVWRAGWYSGETAGDLGLSDAMATFDQALADFEA